MNCKCIEETQELLKNNGRKDASIDRAFLVIDNKLKSAIPISYEFQEYKRNGEPKIKKTKGNMIAAYCPFCGIKCESD